MNKSPLRVAWTVLLSAVFAGNTINGVINLYHLGSIGTGYARRYIGWTIGLVVFILLFVGNGLYFHYFTIESIVAPIVTDVAPVRSPECGVDYPMNMAVLRK